MYLGAIEPRIKMRQALEAKIVKAVIKEALRQGYWLSVDDGDSERMEYTRNKASVIDAIMNTDADDLHLYQAGTHQHVGWIRFVYGNDGYDVISDYAANPETESVLIPANKIASRYE